MLRLSVSVSAELGPMQDSRPDSVTKGISAVGCII